MSESGLILMWGGSNFGGLDLDQTIPTHVFLNCALKAYCVLEPGKYFIDKRAKLEAGNNLLVFIARPA